MFYETEIWQENVKRDKEKIQKEVAKITEDMLEKDGRWCDNETWCLSSLDFSHFPIMKEIFQTYFDFAEDENDEIWVSIEYWKEEKEVRYNLICDNDNICVDDLMANEELNALVQRVALGIEEKTEKQRSKEMNERPNETIKDSGSMREFGTGARRDNSAGKGRCDLLPLTQVARVMDDKVIENIALFMETKNKEYLEIALRESTKTIPIYASGLPNMMLEVSHLYAAGAEKYGENNWKNGMPVKCYIDSGTRHYLKTLRGDDDEPHYRGFVWNILCALWTIDNNPNALDDLITIQ